MDDLVSNHLLSEDEDLNDDIETEVVDVGRPELDGDNFQGLFNEGQADQAPAAVSVKKKIVRNPQPKLDADKLKGPRGLIILEDWFKDINFKGKGHEQEDLDTLMGRLQQWTHRLFPKFALDDCLARIEKLGHKKPVQNYVRRLRLDMEEITQPDIFEDELVTVKSADPFDSLIADHVRDVETILNPSHPATLALTDEQRERIARNRLLAEERRLMRLQNTEENFV